jgi:hypothetical protein
MLNLLEKSIALSKVILEHCQQDDWEKVNTLQAQRQQLMSAIANTGLPKDDDALHKCSTLAAKLTTIGAEIEKLSKLNKEKIYTEIKASNKSKRMNTAYKQ